LYSQWLFAAPASRSRRGRGSLLRGRAPRGVRARPGSTTSTKRRPRS